MCIFCKQVLPALYYQLTITIIGTKRWPFVIPDPEWAVTKTIEDFQAEDSHLLENLASKAKKIDSLKIGDLTTPLLAEPA